MWHESGSKVDDLGRVTFLVRSQIRLSLADEASKTWLHLERDFLETPYATIRERQMEVLEKEDGTMNRPAVKLLREKLNAEAQDVMMEQRYVSRHNGLRNADVGRIGCMLQGAWFNAANLIINGLTPSHRPSPQKPFRFVRLVSYSDPRVTDLADTRSRLIERLWLGTTFQREPTTFQRLKVFAKRVSFPGFQKSKAH
jgi:engulfment/cell motility protein 1